MRSPRFLYSLKWRAPVLCLCQCIPVKFGPKTCMRYIPTFRTPVSGSRVTTHGNVTNGPPSAGQQVNTGNFPISGSFITTSWHFPFPDTDFGIHEEICPSMGSIRSFSIKPALGLTSFLNNASISSPIAFRLSAPSASAIRLFEPKALIRTGKSVPVFSNNSAFPPSGDLDTRSTISGISSTGLTYCLILINSPFRSKSSIYSRIP
jgi:hypothetical protein